MDQPKQPKPSMDARADDPEAELERSDEREVPLPPALAARLLALGEAAVWQGGRSPFARARRRAAWTARAGWVLAAAATMAWLVVPSPFARRGAAPAAGAAVSPALALLDSLLADPGVTRAPWAASTDPAAVTATGEVLWDPGAQRGVLRIVGLVPNDPGLAQFQLWIIDAERDARYPVDGGVFDVTSSGEVLVPVTARLRVARPALFAVTLERPGGVVVSARERLVLAAPVEM